jgi:hypothetical protein
MTLKRLIAIGMLAAVAGCAAKVSPDLLRQWQSKTLYTCCNIHYERDEVVDANYYVGANLGFGSPAVVQGMARDSVTFTSGATKLTLLHRYGTQQESFEQYLNKVLVETDPHARFQTFPPKVQEAINSARVERNMTREQVLMSLGYPPTHRTASLEQPTWTYWYNRWVTYTVTFDDKGRVSDIAGTNAPTRNEPIPDPTPVPTPKPAAKSKAKKK